MSHRVLISGSRSVDRHIRTRRKEVSLSPLSCSVGATWTQASYHVLMWEMPIPERRGLCSI